MNLAVVVLFVRCQKITAGFILLRAHKKLSLFMTILANIIMAFYD